jgi:predicted Zn-dependent peptidase
VIAPIALALSLAPAPIVARKAGVTLVTQADPAATLAGTMLFVRAGLDRQTASQNGLAALTAQTVLETPVAGGKSLRSTIDAAGGSIDYVVDPQSVRFYVEGLGPDENGLLGLFASALRSPDFSPATVGKARRAVLRSIGGSSALGVGLQMLDGAPANGTSVSLAQLVPGDVRAFYARTYRTNGAIVSAVGAIGAAAPQLASALAPGSSKPVVEKFPVVNGTSHQLIARRDIDVPWLIARYPAPAFDSRDFGTMLVLSSFVDRTLSAVAQIPTLISRTSADSAVGTVYAFDRPSANLSVYLYGGLGDPSQAFSTALAVFRAVGTAPVTGSLDDYKADARGRFARDASSLEDRAWMAGVFAAGGGSADYLDRAFAAIDAVTPADMRRVARRYLGDPTIALVLPRD